MRRLAIVLLVACAPASRIPEPLIEGIVSGPASIAGVFMENAGEKIFYRCGGPPDEPGWWVRFDPADVAAGIRYQQHGPGYPPSVHYIRARGTLSAEGRFGWGFQNREIVIDSVMEIGKSPGCATAYDERPVRWNRIAFPGQTISGAAATLDGKFIAIATNEGTVSLWRSTSGEKLSEYRFAQPVDRSGIPSVAMTFSHSGKLLAIGDADGWIHVVRVPSAQPVWKLSQSPNADTLGRPGDPARGVYGPLPVGNLAFTSDDKILVSAGKRRAFTWSISSGRRLAHLNGRPADPSESPERVATTSNPERIVGYTPSGLLHVYGIRAKTPLFTVGAPRYENWDAEMKVSPDETFLAIRFAHDSALLMPIRGNGRTHKVGVPLSSMGEFVFSPDGKMFAMSGGTFSVYVWDTRTGEPLAQLPAPYAGAFRMWFTPRADSIVMAGVFESTLLVSPVRIHSSRSRVYAR